MLKMDKELEEWHKLHKFHFYSGSYQTKDLAKYLRVCPRTIQRWIKGKTKPSKEQLAQISKYLKENERKTCL
jgi:transcriptional regulator with XRE-family HTH domain